MGLMSHSAETEKSFQHWLFADKGNEDRSSIDKTHLRLTKIKALDGRFEL